MGESSVSDSNLQAFSRNSRVSLIKQQQSKRERMAYSNPIKASLMFNLALILSFVFISSIAESRVPYWAQSEAVTTGKLICSKAYAVQAGDTCIQVAQGQNITTFKFETLNPNLVCEKLFVGEWLCLDGNV